jgi:two-component system, chemotaxis family, protein-glutamate methylesterase/glutaminase
MDIEIERPRFLVVVGASAGGLTPIVELCAQLDKNINAAICIVIHLPHITAEELLIQRLQRNSQFKCKIAENQEVIHRGTVYFAPPERHLLVKDGHILLGQGPPENRWRPSIDVLFRSAAVAYKGHTIGIILSGLMQDGADGMMAIKECGGTCMVQDPQEAEYPDMPNAVLKILTPDYCASLAEMGILLQETTNNGIGAMETVPPRVLAEAEIAERVALGMEHIRPLGEQSEFTCPDCGGALREMKDDDLVRYRCYTGHLYNQDELLYRQTQAVEETFWIALRMMEERKSLLQKMTEEETRKGWQRSAEQKKERIQELNTHIDRLKQLLFKSQEIA